MSQPLDLYHRTNVDAARAIVATGQFLTRENTREAFVSTHVDGQATGYGEAVVHVRVDAADGSVAKIVKLEHAWRRLDGRNDDGFQVAPFPG